MHFLIDNDGTIYQMVDTQHIGWHAGIRDVNKNSIGIDFSDAYYTKYQNWYVRRGFGERPILEGVKMHGRTLDPFLGYYPIQLEALKQLWKAYHKWLDIPLEYPQTDGKWCQTEHPTSIKGTFRGFNNHYNYTKGKIDCAGLNVPKLLEEVKNEV